MNLQQAMLEAIELARPAMPHPNPRVGSLVLDVAGEVVGRGRHDGPGLPHAEALALAEAGPAAAGGTVVATLEPCSHQGRTPPCAAAIIASGAARVIVGADDPDERVSGSGIAALREAGLEVVTGIERDAAVALDRGYFHHRRTGRPFFTLKVAATLDGQVAAADGTSRWISGEESRRDGHLLRSRSDGVMVGAGTVLGDDPRLDVRLDGYDGPQPRPIVVAGERPIPPDRAVLQRDPVVFAPSPGVGGAVVVPGPDGVDLTAAAGHLGTRGFVDVMVEGGPTLAAGMWRAGLVDRVVWYAAGLLAGGVGRPALAGAFTTLADAAPLEIVEVARMGTDLRITCERREAR